VETDLTGLTFLEQVAGKQLVPVVTLEDGTVLVQPPRDALARRLSLPAKERCRFFDLVIVGGGPAGLTAAIYASPEGIETVVLEKQAYGGQAAITETIENFPGFPDAVGGLELASRLEKQAKRFGVSSLFVAKFCPGLLTVIPSMSGAPRVPYSLRNTSIATMEHPLLLIRRTSPGFPCILAG
jgi:thioredoxin reductase (NADPH)